MKSEIMRISNELQTQKEKIKENTEKIKVNKTLPYLVSNVVEVCDYVFLLSTHLLDLCCFLLKIFIIILQSKPANG